MKKQVIRVMCLAGMLGLSACSQLPSCDSKDTKNIVEKIINNKSLYIGRYVDLGDISEVAFNKDSDIRVCSAELTTTKVVKDITYTINWRNKEGGEFEVTIQ